MRFGYNAGYEAGMNMARDMYERQLAVLREQLADATSYGKEQAQRADAAVDQLMLRVGGRAISTRGTDNEERRIEKQIASMAELLEQGDPTADRPLGTPGSEFDKPNDPRADLLYDLEQ